LFIAGLTYQSDQLIAAGYRAEKCAAFYHF